MQAPGNLDETRRLPPRTVRPGPSHGRRPAQLLLHPVFGGAAELRGAAVRHAGGQGGAGQVLLPVLGGFPHPRGGAGDKDGAGVRGEGQIGRHHHQEMSDVTITRR